MSYVMDHVKEVSWAEIRSEVELANPQLLTALEQIARRPGQKQKLFIAKYPYGQLLVNRGKYLPPCGGEDKCEWCARLFEQVQYSSIPLTLVLDKKVEVCLEESESDRIIPLRLLSRGELFGVFETLDSQDAQSILNPVDSRPPWSVSAGARSVVILAPLKNRGFANKLESLIKKINPESELTSHGICTRLHGQHLELIHLLAPIAASDWKATVLVFPKAWVGSSEDTPRRDFWLEVYKTGWKQSKSLREQAIRQPEREAAYARAVHESRNEDYYLDSMTKHIIAIADGSALGFRPASESVETGPFFEVQNLLVENGITVPTTTNPKPFPFILHPCYIDSESKYAYFSFTKPSHLGPLKKPRHRSDRTSLKNVEDRLKSLISKNPNSTTFDQVGTKFVCTVKQFDVYVNQFAAQDFKTQIALLQSRGIDKISSKFFSTKGGFLNAFVRIVSERDHKE